MHAAAGFHIASLPSLLSLHLCQRFEHLCYEACASSLHTEARPILSALAMSDGRMPCAFSSRPRGLYRRRPAPIDASCFRLGNPFELPLAPEVRLELGGHPEHVEEAIAGGGAGVDRLLRGLQDRAASPDSSDNILQVSDTPGEMIDAGDDQNVAGM
jgi:hypothetical protein